MTHSGSHVAQPTWNQLRPFTAAVSSFPLNVCRAPTFAACGGHRAGQGPGDVCQLTRVCRAGGRFPGHPFRQASSGTPEVRPSAACRAVGLCEEHHLLPSHVSAGIFWWDVRRRGTQEGSKASLCVASRCSGVLKIRSILKNITEHPQHSRAL